VLHVHLDRILVELVVEYLSHLDLWIGYSVSPNFLYFSYSSRKMYVLKLSTIIIIRSPQIKGEVFSYS